MSVPTIPARPTVYKGTQMRSRLEARFAAVMDSSGWQWIYEPRAFGSESGQYLPDFEVRYAPGYGDLKPNEMFFEVRPTLSRALEAIHQAEPLFTSFPSAELWAVWPIDDGWGILRIQQDRVAVIGEESGNARPQWRRGA